MSNTRRRKAKRKNKYKKQHEFNSWAYVIFATIIDTTFRTHYYGSFFHLSGALGSLGQKRQDRLGSIFIGLIDIAFIVLTIYLFITEDDYTWIIFAIISICISIFLVGWIKYVENSKV